MNLEKLSKEKQLDTFRFELLHPVTSEGLGAFISVVSAKSDKAKTFMAKKIRQEQKQEMENSRRNKMAIKELSEIETDVLELAISRLAGWENVQWGDEKELPFNEENARKVLTSCDWIIDQVLAQSNELGNFLTA